MLYTVDILSNSLLVKRVGSWVNIPITIPKVNFDSISSLELKYKAGSSIDTLSNGELLTVYKDGTHSDVSIAIANTRYISTGTVDIKTLSGSLFSSGSVVSIRTSGTAESWLSIEQLTLELEVTDGIAPITGDIIPSSPKFRYRGSKEGAKFQRFSNEVIGSCADLIINKSTPASWDGGSISEYYTLMTLSSEYQHLRRILDWSKS